jgi:GT2 family glycosyltransferase
MPSPLVSIVIVTWNSANYLSRCLTSLTLQSFKDFETILVDNGSQDGTLEGIQEKYPSLNLRIELLGVNQGFARANNIGARLACGRWLALLNTDAFPEADWLENLIEATRENPQYTCFSSRQIQANNPKFLDGAGDAYHVSGLAWKRYLGYPIDRYGLEQIEVFSSCGAAALYIRDAFLDVNGFDEDLFSYLEDVDLGFRLRLQGNRCLYVPNATVHHIGSATLGVASDFALYHYHRNLIWSFSQNMPTGLFWRYLLSHLIANIIYVINYSLRGRGRILWKAKMDALRGLGRAMEKRRAIQSRRQATEEDILRAMERGLFQPYLLGYHLRRTLAAISKNH